MNTVTVDNHHETVARRRLLFLASLRPRRPLAWVSGCLPFRGLFFFLVASLRVRLTTERAGLFSSRVPHRGEPRSLLTTVGVANSGVAVAVAEAIAVADLSATLAADRGTRGEGEAGAGAGTAGAGETGLA